MKRAHRSAGFTLIEVLVALAIVTLGMAALLSTLSSSADSVSYQRDKTFAEWVALNRLTEVRTSLQRPSKGKSDGEVELGGRKWKWSQEIMDTEIKGILRIDVSVRPSDAAGPADRGWYTTVSGITGDALTPPSGALDPFAVPPPGPPGGPGGPGGANNPQQPGTGGGTRPHGQRPTPAPTTPAPTPNPIG
jgi:general secretion pathway protein I